MSEIKDTNNFEILTNWVVITGGPSSGKTTIVNEFKNRGFHSSPESALVH